MHLIERGTGRPVVLCIHGYCQAADYWAPTLDLLAGRGATGIAPDLPGFARSAGEPGPCTMEGYADRLARLLDERGLKSVVLVGGSMGGVVAQYLALRHSARVERLLLVATGGFTADPPAALARADAMEAAPWDAKAVEPIVNGFFLKPPAAERLARFRELAAMASKQAALDAARSNARARPFDQLDRIAVPTLIVQGRHDKARTPEHGAAMRERIPGARLEVIEGVGHTPQLEDPARFHEIALPFLLGRA